MIRKSKTKAGKSRYGVRVHLGNGKYKMLGTYGTLERAKEAEASWTLKQTSTSTTKGHEFAAFWLEGYKQRTKGSSYGTAESAVKQWLKVFANRTLTRIEAQEAEEWARANRWAVPPVVTMLNDAVQKEILDRNPFKGLSQKGRGRKDNEPLTVDEVNRLAAIAENQYGLGSFVLFTAYSGMRVGEVFALKWSDIDFQRNRILVQRRLYKGQTDLPKSNRIREIGLLPEARTALKSLDRGSEWVFTAKRGQQLSQATLTYYWQKIEGAFGKKVTPHELRHFLAHHLFVTMKMSARIVAAQLGHNDGGRLIEILYGHGEVGAIDEVVEGYRSNVVPFPQRKAQ